MFQGWTRYEWYWTIGIAVVVFLGLYFVGGAQ